MKRFDVGFLNPVVDLICGGWAYIGLLATTPYSLLVCIADANSGALEKEADVVADAVIRER